jgi:hypothetical protein
MASSVHTAEQLMRRFAKKELLSAEDAWQVRLNIPKLERYAKQPLTDRRLTAMPDPVDKDKAEAWNRWDSIGGIVSRAKMDEILSKKAYGAFVRFDSTLSSERMLGQTDKDDALEEEEKRERVARSPLFFAVLFRELQKLYPAR